MRATWALAVLAVLAGSPLALAGCSNTSNGSDAGRIAGSDAGRIGSDAARPPDAPPRTGDAGSVIDASTARLTMLASGVCPENLAVDSTAIYWVDTCKKAVRSMPIGGGSPSSLVSSLTIDGTDSLALYGNSLYYTDQTGVYQLPKAGGSRKTLASTPSSTPMNIAADSVHAFWSDSTGTVNGVVRTGGTPFTLASNQTGVGHIAIDPNNIYWITAGMQSANNGTLMQLAFGGSTPVQLASGLSEDGPVVVDGTTVYWGFRSSLTSSIMEVPIGGGSATKLLNTDQKPWDMVLDNGNIYWTDCFNLYRVPAAGGTNVTLASAGNYDCCSVAVDTTNVYWGCQDDGTSVPGAIFKAPK